MFPIQVNPSLLILHQLFFFLHFQHQITNVSGKAIWKTTIETRSQTNYCMEQIVYNQTRQWGANSLYTVSFTINGNFHARVSLQDYILFSAVQKQKTRVWFRQLSSFWWRRLFLSLHSATLSPQRSTKSWAVSIPNNRKKRKIWISWLLQATKTRSKHTTESMSSTYSDDTNEQCHTLGASLTSTL